MNARVTLLADHLQDIPNHANCFGYGTYSTCPRAPHSATRPPKGEGQANFEDLVDELDETAKAIGIIVDADSIVSKVFLEP